MKVNSRIRIVGCFLILLLGAFRMYAQTPNSVYSIMKRVADWQLDSISRNGFRHPERDWTNAALYAGIFRYAGIANNDRYYKFLHAIGEKNEWKLDTGKYRYHADYYRVGDLYARLYAIYKKPMMIRDIKKLADTLILRPHTESLAWKNKIYDREWAWCDALFMGPPPLAALTAVTGDKRYMDLCNKLWWKTTAYLYRPEQQLYYRDGSFFSKKEKNGQPVMWSRGNGWVMGGLVEVLEYMPSNYPDRDRYLKLFREMSSKIASLQQEDGAWHASLLDPASFPVKETSGTAFYCFALAWGINQGYLPRTQFEPVVLKAWKTLTESVHPSGMLGSVQPIGGSPDLVTANDTEVYGVGALLLAGSEVLKLTLKNVPENSFIRVQNGQQPQSLNNLLKKNKMETKRIHYTNFLDGKNISLGTIIPEATTLYLKSGK